MSVASLPFVSTFSSSTVASDASMTPQSELVPRKRQLEHGATAESSKENVPISGSGGKRAALTSAAQPLSGAERQPATAGSPLGGSEHTATTTPAVPAQEGRRASQDDKPPPRPRTAALPLPKLLPRSQFSSRSFYGSLVRTAGSNNAALTSSGLSSQRELEHDAHILRFRINTHQRTQRWAAADRGDASAAAPGSNSWDSFPTQQPAFDLADSQPGLEVFSVEISSEGKRRFIATSRAEFWRRYSTMLPHHRHFYEIIRQGAPCHLYFDLEFQTADNSGLDGAAATDALVELVGEQLRGSFHLDLQPSWVLELDSSNEKKFSRHLIIRIPGTAFASNAHVGAFVLQLCAAAKERREEDPRAALLVVKKGGEEALFVDTAVYTRNRAFRLYLSSKCGKKSVLQGTERYGSKGLTQRELFEGSLITAVDPGSRLLRCFEESEEEAAAAATTCSSRAAAARSLRSLRGAATGALQGAGSQVPSYGPSPHPQVEEFITGVCCEGGVQGRVRCWVAMDGLLILSMRDNRFCGNVGRPHKSNGIFYVVDLKEGVWYQKCYDTECRHYRSPLTPLPPHLQGLWQPPAAPATQASAAGCAAVQQQSVQQSRTGSVWGGCGGCGSSSSGSGVASCQCGARLAEEDEDSLMLQAVELFEATQQQQQQQAIHQQRRVLLMQQQQQQKEAVPLLVPPPQQQQRQEEQPPAQPPRWQLQAVASTKQHQQCAAAPPPQRLHETVPPLLRIQQQQREQPQLPLWQQQAIEPQQQQPMPPPQQQQQPQPPLWPQQAAEPQWQHLMPPSQQQQQLHSLSWQQQAAEPQQQQQQQQRDEQRQTAEPGQQQQQQNEQRQAAEPHRQQQQQQQQQDEQRQAAEPLWQQQQRDEQRQWRARVFRGKQRGEAAPTLPAAAAAAGEREGASEATQASGHPDSKNEVLLQALLHFESMPGAAGKASGKAAAPLPGTAVVHTPAAAAAGAAVAPVRDPTPAAAVAAPAATQASVVHASWAPPVHVLSALPGGTATSAAALLAQAHHGSQQQQQQPQQDSRGMRNEARQAQQQQAQQQQPWALLEQAHQQAHQQPWQQQQEQHRRPSAQQRTEQQPWQQPWQQEQQPPLWPPLQPQQRQQLEVWEKFL